MQISKNNNEYIKNTTAVKSRGLAPTYQQSGNALLDGFSRSFAPKIDSVFYRDSVSFSGIKKPEEKAVNSSEQVEPKEKTVLEKLGEADNLINRTNVFLGEISEKLDYNLKIQEKKQLTEAKKLLAKKELELQKLSESIKQDEERKKLEAATVNLNKAKEALAARSILNNSKAKIRQEKLKQDEERKKLETVEAKTQKPEQEEKPVLSKLVRMGTLIKRIDVFLTKIKEKPDYKLNPKEKIRLQETEKFLKERESYLQKLSESIKQDEERKKLEAVTITLNKVNENLAARAAMNAQALEQKPVSNVVDTPKKIRKAPQKSEAEIKAENDKLSQKKGVKNLARQKELLSKQISGINGKLNIQAKFLDEIEKTPENYLSKKEKNKLGQVKPILKKIETQLEKIEAQLEKTKEEEIKTQKTREKIAQIHEALSARTNIKPSEQKPHPDSVSALVDLTYKNNLNLKSTPDFSDEALEKELKTKVPGIINAKNAATRVSSLSIYLKEKMVGFEVPEYELEGEKKGGYQWFERGLQNLIIGSKKADLQPEEYKDTAKELFGILAVHDKYWKSPDFVDYLASLKSSKTINENQIKAVDATIQAIKELNEPAKIGFGAQEIISMRARAFTPMKFMPEVYENCAYTRKNLSRAATEDEFRPSADHIIPHCWESSQNDDGNFVIASSRSNSERGNMPLLSYLKGSSL